MQSSFIGALALIGSLLVGSASAQATSVNIVALGASNTYGHGRGSHLGGVQPSQAWPAQLQAMLRAKGIYAHVTNAGVPSDTTGDILARLDTAVPSGTQIVILQPGGNDARHGMSADHASNVATIRRRLEARHIKVIMIGDIDRIAPRDTRDPDGMHFNERGHAAIARSLLSRVTAVIK
jgi:acyl-CoA thioesterase-1